MISHFQEKQNLSKIRFFKIKFQLYSKLSRKFGVTSVFFTDKAYLVNITLTFKQ